MRIKADKTKRLMMLIIYIVSIINLKKIKNLSFKKYEKIPSLSLYDLLMNCFFKESKSFVTNEVVLNLYIQTC